MPDFVKLADAYGLAGLDVHRIEEVPAAFAQAQEERGPFLLHFSIDPDANVYPIVPLGAGLDAFQELPDAYV
jgi:acetolactate synthase-1/2/3 large subunit